MTPLARSLHYLTSKAMLKRLATNTALELIMIVAAVVAGISLALFTLKSADSCVSK